MGTILRYTWFMLLDYMRSGRVLVELGLAAVFAYIFLRPQEGIPPTAIQFFTWSGVFTIGLAIYTTSTILGFGDRPQGYLLLTRQGGRQGYLLGHYIAAVLCILAAYFVSSLGYVVLNIRSTGSELTSIQWLLGTLPLLLNAMLCSALMLLLSPLVFSAGWRLVVLGLLALAISSSPLMGTIAQPLAEPLRTVLAAPLIPAFAGFELSVSRNYTFQSLLLLAAQLLMTFGLLMLALYAFARRDLLLSRA